jgi:hypothetical protein
MPMRSPVPFSPPPMPVPCSPVVRDDVALEAIAPAAWDALAPGQPFLSHAFLTSLHVTGCASRTTGWQPRYATAWSDGALVGALPLREDAQLRRVRSTGLGGANAGTAGATIRSWWRRSRSRRCPTGCSRST